jgi:hypothetical protein
MTTYTSSVPCSLSDFNFRTALIWLAVIAAAIALRIWHGPILQSASFHGFADVHTHLGIAHAADVLSNLPFAVAGVWGFVVLMRRQVLAPLDSATLLSAATFFTGLLLTAVGSALYHLSPENAGLAVDRLCMAVAFAGIVAWMLSEQLGSKAAEIALPCMLLAFPAAVLWWHATGDLFPWAIVQFGGITALAWLSFMSPCMRKAGLSLIAWYAAAKVCESLDHEIYDLTMQIMSGHTLKHLLAACAAIPLIQWITSKSVATK